MEHSVDVVDLISTLLDAGKYKEALSVPIQDRYVNIFKDNCWDLISVIIGKIENDTIILKPSLYGVCEELLAIIVQKALPEEALLEFIEQIEVSRNDAQFGIILEPLQQLLLRLSLKRGRSLEWCLNSISTYIGAIPIPEYQLDGKERLLIDSDDNIRRIVKIYALLPPFYSPFLKELYTAESDNKTKQITSAFLISLLGKPLIYVDVDPQSNASSEARKCSSIIIQDICSLLKNLFKLLPYVETSYKESLKPAKDKKDNYDLISPFDQKEKINITTLAGLYYGVLSGHFEVPDFAIPLVYSEEYVVNVVLLCVVHLLNMGQYGPLAKGLSLCREILKLCPNNSSHSTLSIPVHYNLCKALMNVAIYCSYESIRKEAVSLISIYINNFEYKGRCMLIKYILENADHSGMIGFAITIYKNSLDMAFKDSELPTCFIGAQLMSMLNKICYLPFGAESDLVEHADQIITALNFLRYLIIKDNSNKTGIIDFFSAIESDYLEKLRIGLNMSKAHYEEKLKEIEENKNILGENSVSINVGGNILDNIPTENKKQIINSALNAFHLMEGLLARLTECIKNYK